MKDRKSSSILRMGRRSFLKGSGLAVAASTLGVHPLPAAAESGFSGRCIFTRARARTLKAFLRRTRCRALTPPSASRAATHFLLRRGHLVWRTGLSSRPRIPHGCSTPGPAASRVFVARTSSARGCPTTAMRSFFRSPAAPNPLRRRVHPGALKRQFSLRTHSSSNCSDTDRRRSSSDRTLCCHLCGLCRHGNTRFLIDATPERTFSLSRTRTGTPFALPQKAKRRWRSTDNFATSIYDRAV